MRDNNKTKKQLISELVEIRQRLAEVEQSDAERKQAEEERGNVLAEKAAILDTMPEGVFACDLQANIILYNASAEEIWAGDGVDAKELIGKSGFDLPLLRREDVGGIVEIKEEVTESGTWTLIERCTTTGRWESISVSPLKDESGNPRAIVVVVRNITERKRMEEELRSHREHLEQLVEMRTIKLAALNEQLQEDIAERKRVEEALRESEERLRSTLASMDDLVFVLNREGTFLDYYQPLKTLDLYLPPEAFVGKSFREVLPPGVTTSLEAAIDGVMATGAVQRFDYSMRISDQERWFSAAVSMRIDAAGDFEGVTVVVRDITDRKRSEEATRNDARRRRALTARLAEAEEAERKRVVQELHDQVGQNLTALGINLNMMLPQVTDGATNSMHSRLTDSLVLLEQTTERIRNLMADLRPPVLDDYGLLAAVRWYGDQLTSRAGIAVTVEGEDLDPRLPPPVETSLFRIIQEALTNVVKHAQVAEVSVMLEPKNETLRLTIADEGAGFNYSQLSGPHERPGWGLMTMAERAEAMGACFSINSRPGHGTQIVVEVNR